MLQAVTHFYVVPRSLLVNLSPCDSWYLNFAHNYEVFCERRWIRISHMGLNWPKFTSRDIGTTCKWVKACNNPPRPPTFFLHYIPSLLWEKKLQVGENSDFINHSALRVNIIWCHQTHKRNNIDIKNVIFVVNATMAVFSNSYSR